MIECPYCDGQGEVLNAVIKKSGEKLKFVTNAIQYGLKMNQFQILMAYFLITLWRKKVLSLCGTK